MSSVKLGHSRQNSAPLLDPYLGQTWIRPPAFMRGTMSSLFSASDTFEPMAGGVISPAMVLPLSQDDQVNNHLFIGIQPRHSQHPLCQVEAIPRK